MRSKLLESCTPGGMEVVFLLGNYSDEASEKADLYGAKCIIVRYPGISRCETLMDPEIYTVVEDVRFFKIDEEMQKIAQEQGIDWYQVWPTLEKIVLR